MKATKIAQKLPENDVYRWFHKTNVSRDFGSIERMNSWDAKFRTTKVYLDDKKPTLEMLVPIKGGVTTACLEDDIQTWSMLFPKFVEYMAGGNL